MSKIAVIGAGYVGLTTAACLADLGNAVTVVDINQEKIAQLKRQKVPFYEPGLGELVDRNARAGRLKFATDYEDAIPGAEYAIIAVSTPEGEGGEADLSYVEAAAGSIADHMDGPLVVVNKSTVPPLTGDMVAEVLNRRNGKYPVSVVSNPEFLREGSAIQDFMHPDRVVVGSHDRKAAEKVAELYAPLEAPVLITPNIYTAEMVKYASNAFLATRISFINEIARISERVGADAKLVAEGMGLDKRIGSSYLDAGIGYGGSCLVGDETVLVRQGGRSILAPLSEVFALFQGRGGIEVQSWQRETGAVSFMPVRAATLRPYEGDVLEIKTTMGRRIACTPDHPFVTKDGVKLAEELTTADWLPLAVEADPRPAEERAELQLHPGLGHGGLQRRQAVVGSAPQVLAGGPAAELRPTLTVGRPRVVLRAGAPFALAPTPALWRVVGLYLARGRVSRQDRGERVEWSFDHRGSEELVEEMRAFWAQHGVKADVRRTPPATSVTISSRLLAGFWLGVLELGRGCDGARLPDQIWDQPIECKRALLAGYWLGAGSWSCGSRGPSVGLEWGASSRDLADGLVRLLAELGVVASIRTGRPARSTPERCWIRCSGADQVERLLDLLPERDRQAIEASIRRQSKRIGRGGYRRDAADTAWVRVAQVRRRPFSGAVYSLEVPATHTFVTTGGLVTHNCFPKDVAALAALAERFNYHPEMLHAVMDINRDQRMLAIDKLRECLDSLDGRVIGLLGLAFKPNTDDLREAPSIDIAKVLLAAGAQVRAYDPAAMERTRQLLPDVEYMDSAYAVANGADAIVIVTEWNEFRHLDLGRLRASMRKPVLVDGRNIYDPEVMRGLGFTYRGVGRE